MGVYTCDNCPHVDIMFCHNCLNEDKSPLLNPHTKSGGDFGEYGNALLAKKILEPWEESDRGLKRYLIVGHSGPGGGGYINEVITADSEESAALWFYKTFSNTCSIVNIIRLK